MVRKLTMRGKPTGSDDRNTRPGFLRGIQGLRPAFSKTLFRWILLLTALASFLLLMLRVFRDTSADSANHLIAQAYAERRTVEVRIAGAAYAPLRQERGTAGSSLSQPESLIQAELAISEHLNQNPSDPSWLQAKARVDLLDHNFESALQSLRRTLEKYPDSPQLLTDLASGYFEQAQATERGAIDYGNAVEYLGEALAQSPDDPVALFNRAIACEKIFLYAQAIEDWTHYLRVDPTGGWSDEARSRLSEIRAKLNTRDRIMAEPLLLPSELANLTPQVLGSLRKLDERVEEYLSIATTQWLPMAYPLDSALDTQQSDTRSALRALARWLEEQHGDSWLSDLLAASSSSNFPSAVAALSKALNANDSGDTAAAQQYARDADTLFTSAHNLAGALRARVEYIFAAHIAQDGVNCLRAATKSQHSIENHPYLWLRGQYHLEAGTCFWLAGSLGKARDFYQTAAREAEASKYNALYLRSQDHIAGLDGTSGNFRASWERIHDALQRFWSGSYPPMRGYNLYYNLHESARARKQGHLQMSTWGDGLTLSKSFTDHILRAMAHSLMANAAIAAGQPTNAENEFQLAEVEFNLSPPIKSTRIARLEAETRLAEVEIGLGKLRSATNRLQALEPEVAQLSDNFLGLLFYTNLGEAETRLKDDSGAESALHAAIAFAEQDLQSLKGERAKLEWSQRSSEAYRNLAELKLHQGDTTNALEIWEWYRGAALRSKAANLPGSLGNSARATGGLALRTGSPENFPLPRLAEVTNQLPTLTAETILSYMRLREGYVVWVYDARGVSKHTIPGTAARVDSLSRSFRRLCSDRNSDLDLLKKQGRILYDLLIAPVEEKLSPGRSLVIEADGALNGIAFDALVDTQERYFAERSSISSSLGFYYRSHLHPAQPIALDSNALVVAVPMPKAPDDQMIQPLPDAADEGAMVQRKFRSAQFLLERDATLEAIRARLASAAVFHFAGHAIASARQTGLLLSDGPLSYESLSGIDLSRMQLAVLSGCDTVGDIEGADYNPDSLIRLFVSAGVPRVVASRWNVDSAATKRFMELFYQDLLGGKSVAEALSSAEAGLRAKKETAHPYYWAAFTEFGNN
jgi:CHAT domain-containing protein